MSWRSIGTYAANAMVAVAMTIVSPAYAQLQPSTQTGSKIARSPETVDPKVARRLAKDFGRCIYRRDSALTERLLESSDPLNVDYDLLGGEKGFQDKFQLGECLEQTMTEAQLEASLAFSSATLRRLLAEEAYLGRHSQPLALAEGSGEVLPGRFFVASPDIEQAKSLGFFADCVVFHASADADKVLRTVPTSPEERAAVVALVPAISKCIVQGSELEVTPQNMRGLVADGLWARAHYGASKINEAAE